MLNLSRSKVFPSEWCGLEKTVTAQVSSASLDNGPKLRRPSPMTLVLLHKLVFSSSGAQTRDPMSKMPKHRHTMD
ncbi:hypothetical protein TNCV_371311 [Trichonephila clavipes]|nr:hypothetical protein TNCV_371311 [Trichonephila clavipes]